MIPSGSRPARNLVSGAGSADFGRKGEKQRSILKAKSRVPRSHGMRLFALLLAGALNQCGALILSPVLPFFAINKLGATALDLAMLSSVYSLFQMVSSPLLGFLSDRVGRKSVLLGGLLASAVLYHMQTYADCLWKLYLCRGFLGFVGGTVPVEIAYITDLTTKEERPKVLKWHTTVTVTGALLGPAIGGILFESDTFAQLCSVMAVVCLVNMILGLIFFETPTRVGLQVQVREPALSDAADAPKRSLSVLSRFKNRTTGLLLFAAFMDCFALGISDGPEPFFMKVVFNFDEMHLALFFMVCSGSALLCSNLIPARLKDANPKQVCVIFSVLTSVAMLTLFVFRQPWEPYLYAFFSCCCNAVVETVASTTLLNNMVAQDQQGTMYGLEHALINAGFLFGSPLGGCLFDIHPRMPYAASVCCLCLSASAYALLPTYKKRSTVLLQVEAEEARRRPANRVTQFADQVNVNYTPLQNKNFVGFQLADKAARQAWFVDEDSYSRIEKEREKDQIHGVRRASSIHIPAISSGTDRDQDVGLPSGCSPLSAR